MRSTQSSKQNAATRAPQAKHAVTSDKAVRLLASSIYRQLQDEGCEARDIISVSSQLIDLVTHELRKVDESI